MLFRSDATSPLQGRGRFNFECWLLSRTGLIDPVKLSPSERETAQFLFDGIFPFVVMMLVSLASRAPARDRVDQFYGKMKTPVGDTPALEAAAMAETRRNPRRFDATKLLGPDSAWEFARWNRTDTLGFLGCCVVSAGIIGIFVTLLRLASGH